jgi:hypothetical protein
MVLLVCFEVIGQVGNPLAQDSDLNFGRTRVRVVVAELTDQLGLSRRSVPCVTRAKSLEKWVFLCLKGPEYEPTLGGRQAPVFPPLQQRQSQCQRQCQRRCQRQRQSQSQCQRIQGDTLAKGLGQT